MAWVVVFATRLVQDSAFLLLGRQFVALWIGKLSVELALRL